MHAPQQYTAQRLILGGVPLVIDGPPETNTFELQRSAAHTVVVVVAEPDTADALSWNDWFCEHEQPFLLLAPGQNATIVGPLVIPQQSPCLRCLALQRALGVAHASAAATSGYSTVHTERALRHLHMLLQRRSLASLIGRQLFINGDGSVMTTVAVTRFAGCSGCRGRPYPAEIYYATQLFQKH
ncbi:hypothetical protein [Kallotenue papyrolyticum]|uniref:hypothetical protein n=1 Tax=Kallotenue papyrolyticum TaxID=1325125 RepID=UPI0004928B7B|nr:hypothetical protein [Kallotenue papyrolyticum]